MISISSFLCSLSLMILYVSGWFSYWNEAFQTSRSNINFVLLTMFFLSLCQPWMVHSKLYIHPAWMGFLLVFIYLGSKLSLHSLIPLISSSFCAGTFFLLGHELIKANTDWTYKPFQFMLFFGMILFSFLISPRLPERICFLGMSFMTLYIWILYFHQDGFTPIVLGSNVFIDILWLSLTGILSAHSLENFFRERISKKRLYLSKL